MMSVKGGQILANILPPMLVSSEKGLIFSFGIGTVIAFFGLAFVGVLYFLDLEREVDLQKKSLQQAETSLLPNKVRFLVVINLVSLEFLDS